MTLELQIPKLTKKLNSAWPNKLSGSLRHPVCAFFLAIVLFVLSITYLSLGLKLWAEKVDLKPGVVETMGINPHFDTFEGSLLQQQAFATPGVLPIYGSSEMSMINDYHPAKVLTPGTGVTPFLVGKGGTQTIIHVLNLASLDDIKGKKVAIFLTPQWYASGGIPQSFFEGNFSALHAYQILFSSKLSPRLKQQIAARILNFPGAYKDYPYLEKMLSDELGSGYRVKMDRILNWIPAQMEYTSLEIKDVSRMNWHVHQLSQKTIQDYSIKNSSAQGVDWDKLREEAKTKGKNSTTNNSFGMDDTFYQDNLASKLQDKKDTDKNFKLATSPEYDDLTLLMQVLKEKGAKPLFVIIPMNGRWYDYTGLDHSEREQCYTKLRTVVQEAGYPVADFSSHEYEDYYLKDPWHLAWKGWVDVDQRLYEFSKEGTN